MAHRTDHEIYVTQRCRLCVLPTQREIYPELPADLRLCATSALLSKFRPLLSYLSSVFLFRHPARGIRAPYENHSRKGYAATFASRAYVHLCLTRLPYRGELLPCECKESRRKIARSPPADCIYTYKHRRNKSEERERGSPGTTAAANRSNGCNQRDQEGGERSKMI